MRTWSQWKQKTKSPSLWEVLVGKCWKMRLCSNTDLPSQNPACSSARMFCFQLVTSLIISLTNGGRIIHWWYLKMNWMIVLRVQSVSFLKYRSNNGQTPVLCDGCWWSIQVNVRTWERFTWRDMVLQIAWIHTELEPTSRNWPVIDQPVSHL